MIVKQNPLLDQDFLLQLDQYRNKISYARITSLTINNFPVERIEGAVQQGNINLDSKSSMRRVCSLTLTAENIRLNNIYWALSTRIKIEIGIQNDLVKYQHYPKIIWFPLGVFILTDFKTQVQVKKYTITIQGKDKMCLLNGDIGGNFNAETQLDTERVFFADGGYKDEKRPLYYIIRELIHHYAQENYENIIIKDIDKLSLKLLNNKTTHPYYLVENLATGEIQTDIFGEDIYQNNLKFYYKDFPGIEVNFKLLKSPFYFRNAVGENQTLINSINPPTVLTNEERTEEYVVIKVDSGEDLGYEFTETYYPDELIAGVGDTVTSVLDKIIKTFGNFEYFYNLNGQFVFQEKQTYVNNSWNNLITNKDSKENYVEPYQVSKKIKYSFEGSRITTAYQNNPALGKIKNDFTVWGKIKTTSGLEIPIHSRYAIDKKPLLYYSFDKIGYISEEFANEIKEQYEYTEQNEKIILNNEIYKIVDWREIIYQMAKDYYAHNQEDTFSIMIQRNNNKILKIKNSEQKIEFRPYEFGRTNYEHYYHDIFGFWRSLYLPEEEMDNVKILDDKNLEIVNKDNFYSYTKNKNDFTEKKYIGPWNKQIEEAPSSLIFWFDFLEADTLGLGKFSIPAIGDRPKNENNDQVRAIVYKNVPNVIFVSQELYDKYYNENRLLSGYSCIVGNSIILKHIEDGKITISTRGISTQERIDTLLYENAYSNETISISSIPIYYLEPNTIISARDEERYINGYYIINKITLPLDFKKGIMKITAIKVPERIY